MRRLVLIMLLVGCAPATGPGVTLAGSSPPTSPTNTPPPTEIILPDANTCLHAGFGATLAYEGERLTYTCENDEGLLGEVGLKNTELSTELAELDGTTVLSTQPLSFTVWKITLDDGIRCLHAGFGATLTFEGQRLNYTCGDSTGLIGDLTIKEGAVSAEKVVLEGTRVVSSQRVKVRRLSGVRNE